MSMGSTSGIEIQRYLAARAMAHASAQLLGLSVEEYDRRQAEGRRAIAARQRELVARHATRAPQGESEPHATPHHHDRKHLQSVGVRRPSTPRTAARFALLRLLVALALLAACVSGCAPTAGSTIAVSPPIGHANVHPSIRWGSENHISIDLANDVTQRADRTAFAVTFADVPTYGCPTTPLTPVAVTLPGPLRPRMTGVLQPDACTVIVAGDAGSVDRQCTLTIANQGPGHTTLHIMQGRHTACFWDRGLHYAT